MRTRFLPGIQGWKKYVLIYGVLLVLSHLMMWLTESPIQEKSDANAEVQVQRVLANQELSSQELTIKYQDVYNGEEESPPVLLMVPGGPEGPDVFNNLVSKLSSKYRVIVPHLPAFGNKNKHLPDYSFRSLSVYLNQMLDKLGLSNVDVLGYGLGGASAVYLANDNPQKVRSLSLVSSIGVQELELLGSYRLNHAVHGVQLGAIWLLHNAVPHFGLLDALEIDVSYARSHYDSDQRPLRDILKEYKKPMLILHGTEDALVPMAAAKEHRRIVPQSTLKTFNADHDLIKTHSDSVAQAISTFLGDIKTGVAKTAESATESRIEEAKKSFSNVEFTKFQGASLLIIMVIIVFSTFISEDLTCIGAGLLAARGLIGFWPATLACLVGIYVGDIGLYLAGRVMGRPAVKRAPFRWFINERDLEKSANWFKRKGPAIIIATRFLPGSRMPTYFSAGVIRANFWMFSFYFLLAAVVWTPMLVGMSKLLGNELLRYFSVYQDYALWVFIGAIIFLILIIKLIIPAFSYKGRRLLVSRYRKLTRWEYWSPFVIYAPVFCYILYLGIKHRCMTLFTAANPAIPDGGFVGESKSQILELFGDQDCIAKYCLIPADLDSSHKFERARQFMEDNELDYPVVLKPDVGERGKGVSIIRDAESMQNYLRQNSRDLILQEYLAGDEFGVFYYRMPDEEKGHIFSITAKHLLHVEGDGERSLYQLILSDDQAVNLAKRHLEKNEERLYEVPDDGEEVPLVELGTHALGAIFTDGEELITNKLEERLDEICEPASEYYFGRFDIKAPSPEKLANGEDVKVIEANGVTSESTNIYDAQYSYWDAQRILCKQWKIAFDIGAKNREKGNEAASLWPFIKRVFYSISK